MGRYATRENEIDKMLRAGLFVDLYAIVRHAIRVSIEKADLLWCLRRVRNAD